MIIQFKSAPELGRLMVVSDSTLPNGMSRGCAECALREINCVDINGNCIRGDYHFEQVRPNE